MKRCPVCGVMMGDNVARCSMCKYNFFQSNYAQSNYIQDKSDNIIKETKTKFSWLSFLLGLGIGLIILIIILLIK